VKQKQQNLGLGFLALQAFKDSLKKELIKDRENLIHFYLAKSKKKN